MWWVKIIGSCWIVFGCLCWGFEHIRMDKQRILVLKEMHRSLILFKGFGETYRLPLGRLCEMISEQIQEPVAELYRKFGESLKKQDGVSAEIIWQQKVEAMDKAFDKEDQMLFLQMGSFWGVQDLKMQNRGIDACMMGICQRIGNLEEKLPEKERLTRVLSLTVSGFLIVLLI